MRAPKYCTSTDANGSGTNANSVSCGLSADHVRQRGGGEDDGVGAVHDGRAEQLAHGVQVVGRPRHDVAGAVLLEEARRLRFEVREEVVAEVELDLARGSDDDLPRDVEECSGDGGDAEQLAAPECAMTARAQVRRMSSIAPPTTIGTRALVTL